MRCVVERKIRFSAENEERYVMCVCVGPPVAQRHTPFSVFRYAFAHGTWSNADLQTYFQYAFRFHSRCLEGVWVDCHIYRMQCAVTKDCIGFSSQPHRTRSPCFVFSFRCRCMRSIKLAQNQWQPVERVPLTVEMTSICKCAEMECTCKVTGKLAKFALLCLHSLRLFSFFLLHRLFFLLKFRKSLVLNATDVSSV